MSPPDEVTPLGIGALGYIDVLPGTSPQALSQLIAIHLEHFGDLYSESAQDFEAVWSGQPRAANIIEHQWLLMLDGVPCGQLIFAVNLPRRMVTKHFTSILSPFRPHMPDQWIPAVTEAISEFCMAQASAHGVELLGMMSEITSKHVAGWRKYGLYHPDIGYHEPLHGGYWREFGEPQLLPILANIKVFPAGREAGLAAVAEAGTLAFLIDTYHLPDDNPTLQAIIDKCRALPPAW